MIPVGLRGSRDEPEKLFRTVQNCSETLRMRCLSEQCAALIIVPHEHENDVIVTNVHTTEHVNGTFTKIHSDADRKSVL